MDRGEAKRRLDSLRRHVVKRERDKIHGTAEYTCGCGARMKVGLGVGVHVIGEHSLELAAPWRIECLFPDCSDSAHLDYDSYDYAVEPTVAYLRIPSRRAAIDMANRGVVEAQLVVTG